MCSWTNQVGGRSVAPAGQDESVAACVRSSTRDRRLNCNNVATQQHSIHSAIQETAATTCTPHRSLVASNMTHMNMMVQTQVVGECARAVRGERARAPQTLSHLERMRHMRPRGLLLACTRTSTLGPGVSEAKEFFFFRTERKFAHTVGLLHSSG